MIKVKHVMDTIEDDDGQRIWVEPIGLTHDLREWCKVDHLLSHLGPPSEMADFLEEHPDDYDRFRAGYHEVLEKSAARPLLMDLVAAARHGNFTLLHHGNDPHQNTAAALHEFLAELDAYVPPEA